MTHATCNTCWCNDRGICTSYHTLVQPGHTCSLYTPTRHFRDVAHVDSYYSRVCALWRDRPSALAQAMHRHWLREWGKALGTV